MCLNDLLDNEKLQAGHIIRDNRQAKVIFGDDANVEGHRDFNTVVNSGRGRDYLIKELMEGLRKLSKHIKDECVFRMSDGENLRIY